MNGEAVREMLVTALVRAGVWPVAVVDDLLPVVREIAAEELREAADHLHKRAGFAVDRREDYAAAALYNAEAEVRARADALTKPPDGPVR